MLSHKLNISWSFICTRLNLHFTFLLSNNSITHVVSKKISEISANQKAAMLYFRMKQKSHLKY